MKKKLRLVVLLSGDGSIFECDCDRRSTLANNQDLIHVQRVMSCGKAEASDFGRPGMAEILPLEPGQRGKPQLADWPIKLIHEWDTSSVALLSSDSSCSMQSSQSCESSSISFFPTNLSQRSQLVRQSRHKGFPLPSERSRQASQQSTLQAAQPRIQPGQKDEEHEEQEL